MEFAGIDYSTNAVDIVIVGEDCHPRWHQFPLVGSDAFDRTRAVRDALPARSSSFWDRVVAVGIEEPMAANPKMRQTVAKLKAIQGAILACLPSATLAHPFNAGEWRVAVGLPGNASKLQIAEWTIHSAPIEVADKWPQDAFDAYCLALAIRSSAIVEAVA